MTARELLVDVLRAILVLVGLWGLIVYTIVLSPAS